MAQWHSIKAVSDFYVDRKIGFKIFIIDKMSGPLYLIAIVCPPEVYLATVVIGKCKCHFFQVFLLFKDLVQYFIRYLNRVDTLMIQNKQRHSKYPSMFLFLNHVFQTLNVKESV